MKKHIIPLIVLSALPGAACMAQNLVTNPGFEQKNHCPTQRGEISYTPYYDYFATVLDWVSPLNTSPDYFNRCGTDSSITIPYLIFDGYHEPHSGDAYAGISMFTGAPNMVTKDYWSEYLETKLSAPMIAGHAYYVSYYTSMAYHSPQYYNIIAIDRIGARLTVDMIDTQCKGPMFYLNGPADIETPRDFFITDTTQWTLVSGIYKAKGGEQWLTIGSFYMPKINAKLLYSPVNNIDSIHCACYMLVDDVCVTDMENPAVSDTTIYSPQFPITIGHRKSSGEYHWNTGDTSAQIAVMAPGIYERQSWSECSYYVDTFRVAEMAVESCVWLPSAFTPNNDGENDVFGPGNTYCQPDLQNFSFAIFNRWGQAVFQTNTPGEKWNGTFNGVPQPMGVYPYILKYSYKGPLTPSGASQAEIKMVKGDVTLIR